MFSLQLWHLNLSLGNLHSINILAKFFSENKSHAFLCASVLFNMLHLT